MSHTIQTINTYWYYFEGSSIDATHSCWWLHPKGLLWSQTQCPCTCPVDQNTTVWAGYTLWAQSKTELVSSLQFPMRISPQTRSIYNAAPINNYKLLQNYGLSGEKGPFPGPLLPSSCYWLAKTNYLRLCSFFCLKLGSRNIESCELVFTLSLMY